MSSERIEVVVGDCPLGENRRIAGSDQPATFAFERFEHKRCAALDMPLSHFPVDEIDDVVRKSNGDLLAHTEMVPMWDADRYRS